SIKPRTAFSAGRWNGFLSKALFVFMGLFICHFPAQHEPASYPLQCRRTRPVETVGEGWNARIKEELRTIRERQRCQSLPQCIRCCQSWRPFQRKNAAD